MPFNGSGTFSVVNEFTPNTTILSSEVNDNNDDIAEGLTTLGQAYFSNTSPYGYLAQGTAGQVVLQRVRVALNRVISTAIIPFDSTIPQKTEGDEIASTSITPLNSASIIRVRAFGTFTIANVAQGLIALFRNADSDAVSGDVMVMSTSVGVVAQIMISRLQIDYQESPGSVSPITFSVRMGPGSAGSTGQMNVLNDGLGGFYLGGVVKNYLEIEEWLDTP